MIEHPTMQAALLEAHGGPFRLAKIARPVPGDGEFWFASLRAASIRSIRKSMPGRRSTRNRSYRRFSASTLPARLTASGPASRAFVQAMRYLA